MGYGERVHDVWLATMASDTLMCLTGKVESFGYEFNFLAMLRSQVCVYKFLKGCIYSGFLLDVPYLVVIVHSVTSVFSDTYRHEYLGFSCYSIS